MRMFVCAPFGDLEVDLDDPATYSHLPNTINELRELMFARIGYAYCYMYYWHPDIYSGNIGDTQKINVKAKIKYFTENERANYNNIMWYKEQVFLFDDEIENMC